LSRLNSDSSGQVSSLLRKKCIFVLDNLYRCFILRSLNSAFRKRSGSREKHQNDNCANKYSHPLNVAIAYTLNSNPVECLVFKEEKTSFAVGHMALAYLLGKGSAKPLKVNLNIPLILVLSIIPDIDILFERLFQSEIHRGPTHSLVIAILVFIPFFVLYRQKALPYLLALASHALIGDFFIGGQVQLLWPLSTRQFGLHESGFYYPISIFSPLNVALELTLFIISTVIMFKTKDWQVFFRNNKSNLVLIVPIFTVLLPTFVGYPFSVPLLLTLPVLALAHLFYLILFSVSVSIVLYRNTNWQTSADKPAS